MPYTLGQAAKATGLSKPTIANAIKKGRISALKDDIGQYAIDPAELHRVFPAVNPAEIQGKKVHESSLEKSSEILALRGRVEALERLLKELERSRDSAEADKQAWQEEAAHLRKLLAAPPSVIHAAGACADRAGRRGQTRSCNHAESRHIRVVENEGGMSGDGNVAAALESLRKSIEATGARPEPEKPAPKAKVVQLRIWPGACAGFRRASCAELCSPPSKARRAVISRANCWALWTAFWSSSQGCSSTSQTSMCGSKSRIWRDCIRSATSATSKQTHF